MKKVANNKCHECVHYKEEFKGSNLTGKWINLRFYVVKSYDWYPLFIYDQHAKKWYENSEHYSVSTSKQKSQARPRYFVTNELDLEGMKTLLNSPVAIAKGA